MATDYVYYNPDINPDDYLEEEVGCCYCPDCKEGAVLLRLTNTKTNEVEFLSNCCYVPVDVAYTDYNPNA